MECPTLVPSVTYPNPWKGGILHLRDAVGDMLTGSLAVLDVAAKYRERFVYGIYQVGARQIALGRSEAPVAYVIPAAQHDGPASLAFIDTLMKGGIEVHRASAPFVADSVTYAAGTYVVLLAQPFRPFAKDLLERQVYPDLRTHPGGPPIPPYDTAGWTLSYQMGVRTVAVANGFDTSALVPVESTPASTGALDAAPRSRAWGYVISASANVSAIAIIVSWPLARRSNGSPARSARAGVNLAPGVWVVRGGPSDRGARRGMQRRTRPHRQRRPGAARQHGRARRASRSSKSFTILVCAPGQ